MRLPRAESFERFQKACLPRSISPHWPTEPLTSPLKPKCNSLGFASCETDMKLCLLTQVRGAGELQACSQALLEHWLKPKHPPVLTPTLPHVCLRHSAGCMRFCLLSLICQTLSRWPHLLSLCLELALHLHSGRSHFRQQPKKVTEVYLNHTHTMLK